VVGIGEAKEGLDVFDFPQFQPIEDGLHFVFSHVESIGGKNISEVFHTVPVEFAFPGIGMQAMLLESVKDFFGVLFVLGHVIKVD
jgi:hypothetical protein